MIGLLPAAGRGVRAYPYTATVPKSMLEVDGVPNLERNVVLLRDQLGCREVRIVIGHHGHVIRAHFGDGSRLGIAITYIENDRLDWELPYSVYLGTRDLTEPCCILLADECYIGSRCIVAEGATVGTGTVLGAGSILTASVPVIDAETGEEISRGHVPSWSVAVTATRPREFAGGTFGLPCVLVIKRLTEGERHDKSKLNEILREGGVST